MCNGLLDENGMPTELFNSMRGEPLADTNCDETKQTYGIHVFFY